MIELVNHVLGKNLHRMRDQLLGLITEAILSVDFLSKFLLLFHATIDSPHFFVSFDLVDVLEGPITRALKVLERSS